MNITVITEDPYGHQSTLQLTFNHFLGLVSMLYLISEELPEQYLFKLITINNRGDKIPFDYYSFIQNPSNKTLVDLISSSTLYNPQIESWSQFIDRIKSSMSPRKGNLIESKYCCILSYGNVSGLFQFDHLDFIQGVIDVCNWYHLDWSNHIHYLHQLINTSTGIVYLPISVPSTDINQLTEQLSNLTVRNPSTNLNNLIGQFSNISLSKQ